MSLESFGLIAAPCSVRFGTVPSTGRSSGLTVHVFVDSSYVPTTAPRANGAPPFEHGPHQVAISESPEYATAVNVSAGDGSE
jgi:hypothetical protein